MLLHNKTLLVTGGTGSLGMRLVHRILSGELGTPKKVIVFSRDEAKQHDMRISYLHKRFVTDEVIYRNFMNVLEFRIGDIRNYADVSSALRYTDIVFNAAALKQIPVCEYFPSQALLTNCTGAVNVVRAIEEHGYPVETVVAISTDKACKPVCAMGISKALQERIIIAANILNAPTRFICVRYGNVLASRGSVIPLFHEQIRNGGPVTVTDPAMTRFLLNLDQAVDTVFAALSGAQRGEIYIPTPPAASMMNIARALIGDRRIPISITGIRPGEKMHEILVSEEEMHHCVRRGTYLAVQPMLPELASAAPIVPALTAEYSSAHAVLDYTETVELLKNNNMLLDAHAASD